MKFGNFKDFLLLIYETSFYFVVGQTVNNEEMNDCSKLHNFLYGNSKNNTDDCCSNDNIDCDYEKFIKGFSIDNPKDIIPDLTFFPNLSRIETLRIYNIGLKEIPNTILKLTTLKILNLSENKIKVIPSDIKNLSQLEELSLSVNEIEVIPPVIQDLSQLKELNLNYNFIKELPKELFNLRNLKQLNLENNPNLNTVIMNFGNSTVDNCYFDVNSISCYENRTCQILYLSNKYIHNNDLKNDLKMCTLEDIDEFLNPNQNENSSFVIVVINIILGIIIGILFTVITIGIKKIVYKKSNKPNFISDNELQNENNRVILYNNNNNEYSDVGNNNNNNNNNHKSIRKQKPPPNDNNSNIYNALVVKKDEAPLSDDNSNKIMNINAKDETSNYNASTAVINKSQPVYDNNIMTMNYNNKSNMNMNIYNTSIYEENEPQSDYTETNKLISKY